MSERAPRDETKSIELSPGASEGARATPHRSREAGAVPEQIGPYKILNELGEGGMGAVYLAEQSKPIHRRVALKIIKLGMDTKSVVARFEIERAALALMNHPNVAQVFDAGATETGRPYFVMEYVPGIPITEYCDEHRLAVEERLALFIDVCNAIQHAHQKGIIHRDIKPSNVLVAVQVGKPIAKVIDFGVAKATQQRLTERTLYTEHGQMIGTPGYMSPEQAEVSDLDVDTRTDIYSLGVLLYELLVGSRPFDERTLRQAGFAEIQRVIREVDPPKPSTRFSSLGADSTVVAEKRRTGAKTLSRQLRGDLDWVVMKCLEKDRTRRYSTGTALAEDVGRYLRHDPVEARPPSFRYQVTKFVRRHRNAVAATIAMLAILLFSLVMTTFLFFRAEAAKRSESEQRIAAEDRAEQLRRTAYRQCIALAQSAMESSEMRRAKELLAECSKDLRGWEWDRLKYLSDRSELVLSGHRQTVVAAAFARDGTLVSGAIDGAIKTWDPVRGQERKSKSVDWHIATCLALDPERGRIATGGADSILRIWDIEGKEVLRKTWGLMFHLAFSPKGDRIAAKLSDGTVHVIDVATGEIVATLKDYAVQRIGFTAFSQDATRLVTGGADGAIHIWSSATGEHSSCRFDHESEVVCGAISADGRQIATGGDDGTIKLWATDGDAPPRTLRGHIGGVTAVAFNSEGTRIVTGGRDKTVRVWNAATAALLTTLRGHEDAVHSVAFSYDGTRIASAGAKDMRLRIWDPNREDEVLALRNEREGFRGLVAVDPSAQFLLSAGSSDCSLIKWNLSDATQLRPAFQGHSSPVTSVAISPLGDTAVGGSGDGTLRVWDCDSGRELELLVAHERDARAVAFTLDGRELISGGADGQLKFWDTNSWTLRLSIHAFKKQVSCIAVSPDGEHVAAASLDFEPGIWAVATGEKKGVLSGHKGAVPSVAFSHDGSMIATASWDTTLMIWDSSSRKMRLSLRGHDGNVVSAAFSPDGRRLVSGSEDSTVRVWDTSTGGQLLTLRGHAETVDSVTFTPDGQTIVSGARDGVRIWRTTATD